MSKAQSFFGKVIGAPAENLVGLLITDPLVYIRTRNLSFYEEKIREIHEKRGVKSFEAVSPSVAIPLIEAATNETRDELREIWAKLLAAATDPARAERVRSDIIATVKRMEPVDARILQKLYVDYGRDRKLPWTTALQLDGENDSWRNSGLVGIP